MICQMTLFLLMGYHVANDKTRFYQDTTRLQTDGVMLNYFEGNIWKQNAIRFPVFMVMGLSSRL
jgi:hypothetical protein